MKTILAFLCLFAFACQPQATKTVTVEVPIPQLPIEQPPPVEPGKPGFLRFDEIEQYADRDIKTLNAQERLDTRYLLLCNFYDQGITELDDAQAGVNKGLNMISTERLITKSDIIDDAGCVARINLDDIGMTSEEWQKIERANVLPFISDSVRGRTLRALTQTNQPLVHASSFFLTVMQADQVSIGNQLYYDLTEQPLNDLEFLAGLGINLQAEFNEEEPACAGGGRSQIALGKPRLICIMDTTQDGFLLVTYDVSLARNDSISLFLLYRRQYGRGRCFWLDRIACRNRCRLRLLRVFNKSLTRCAVYILIGCQVQKSTINVSASIGDNASHVLRGNLCTRHLFQRHRNTGFQFLARFIRKNGSHDHPRLGSYINQFACGMD